MASRRDVLATGLGAGAVILLASASLASAKDRAEHVKGVAAITEVFGNGQRLTALAVEYGQEIDNAALSTSTFRVEGRTITAVYANMAAEKAYQGSNGRYVIIELSPEDADAPLYLQQGRQVIRKEARATVIQAKPVVTTAGRTYEGSPDGIATDSVRNLIVDDFQQRSFTHPGTGLVLNYNLFVPKNYDQSKSYPLVLFMHDAGATSTVTDTTLVQGLGAVVWASPEDQAKHEAFVLAPQYSTQIVNDQSQASDDLDITVDLVNKLTQEYSIDRNRLYATGQSGGAMMSIAMNIKYPDLFAASFLVAGQWDPALVKPLASDKLWVVVSEGDLKAYPGQNAIMAVLEKDGAKISRAVWSGRWAPEAFAAAVQKVEAEDNPINYVALQKGTVVLPGQDDDGGSNHINTWRIAYQIEGVRTWIFKQHK